MACRPQCVHTSQPTSRQHSWALRRGPAHSTGQGQQRCGWTWQTPPGPYAHQGEGPGKPRSARGCNA
eukprot:6354228-Alexandrium_andersonii.AAC.1